MSWNRGADCCNLEFLFEIIMNARPAPHGATTNFAWLRGGRVGTGGGVPTRLRRVARRLLPTAGVHSRANPEANGAAIRVGDAS